MLNKFIISSDITTNSTSFEKSAYHKILCSEFPEFLKKYLEIDILKRLKGVGLLCGTDWTPLYKNSSFYSRFDHSVGVALVLWNFTHDKKQTIAGLLHDVSTPAFSHVSDFRKGDALKQEATEEENSSIIHNSAELKTLLAQDNLTVFDVDDYHKFPLADNEIPGLSADRLEYMFPSGAILNESFDMESIHRLYNDISICYNELNELEFGFKTLECAVEYCRRFCNCSMVLQKNENKLCLQLMAEILNLGITEEIFGENKLFTQSEKDLIQFFDDFIKIEKNWNEHEKFCSLYKTFRTMKKIERSENPLENHFSISLEVKRRYINPLVIFKKDCEVQKSKRVTELSKEASEIVENFLNFQDAPFGCVPISARI